MNPLDAGVGKPDKLGRKGDEVHRGSGFSEAGTEGNRGAFPLERNRRGEERFVDALHVGGRGEQFAVRAPNLDVRIRGRKRQRGKRQELQVFDAADGHRAENILRRSLKRLVDLLGECVAQDEEEAGTEQKEDRCQKNGVAGNQAGAE